MVVYGVIPARKGSKGVLRKNFKKLCGLPLVDHTINAALESAIDKLILTTDDEEMIEHVEKKYGDSILIQKRPPHLATDTTPTVDVIVDCLKKLPDKWSGCMILQPTSPLRQPRHITQAIKELSQSTADSLISVTEIPVRYNPEWIFFKENGDLKLSTGRLIKYRLKRRQDFPPAYETNGAIYLFKPNALEPHLGSFYGNRTIPFIMDEFYSVNIDTLEDFKEAEKRMKIIQKRIQDNPIINE